MAEGRREEETRVTEALLCWEKEEDSGVKNRKKNDAETGEKERESNV